MYAAYLLDIQCNVQKSLKREDAFWGNGFSFLAFTRGLGFMADDSIYVRSIE